MGDRAGLRRPLPGGCRASSGPVSPGTHETRPQWMEGLIEKLNHLPEASIRLWEHMDGFTRNNVTLTTINSLAPQLKPATLRAVGVIGVLAQ